MRSRNEALENKFNSWLNATKLEELGVWEKALVLNMAKQLNKGTQDDRYIAFLTEKLDGLMSEKDEITGLVENDIANYMLGSAAYYAAKKTGAEKYTNAAKNIAQQLAAQPRNGSGIFVSGANGCCDNGEDMCICEAYCTYPFYVEYETLNGGKERYNDIIAQYNAIRTEKYEKYSANIKENDNALSLAYYAASLIDSMEVVEQPIYENYRRMQDLFKETVKCALELGVMDKVNTEALMFAYAILKGCRMKALHTEKYEAAAIEVLDKAITKDVENNPENDIEYTTAFAFAYGESLRNRQFQDYGRGKGGALWS